MQASNVRSVDFFATNLKRFSILLALEKLKCHDQEEKNLYFDKSYIING